MLRYARLCAIESSAEDLAVETFERALVDGDVALALENPWRYHLLALVYETAVLWAGVGRHEELDPDLLLWLHGAARAEPGQAHAAGFLSNNSIIRAAFHQLPAGTRAMVWHAVVEHDDTVETGRLLGVEPSRVRLLQEAALEHLRRAYLQVHADRSGYGHCRQFTSLLEVATRPVGARPSGDLDQHVAQCAYCSGAHFELISLNEQPAVALAQGLLPWGGAALVSDGLVCSTDAQAQPVRKRGAGRARRGAAGVGRGNAGQKRSAPAHAAPSRSALPGPRDLWAKLRNFPVESLAAPVGLLLAISLIRVLPTPGSLYSRGSPAAEIPARPAPSSPEARSPGNDHSVNGTYAELVNVRSGLCLDIQGKSAESEASVIVDACDGAPSQKWLHTAGGFIRNYANPSFCVDSSGRDPRQVEMRTCSFLDAGTARGEQLFDLWQGGSLRPLSNPLHPYPLFALAPSGDSPGSGIDLVREHGGNAQEWSLGSTTHAPAQSRLAISEPGDLVD
ncbi:ricin-type beta-trefoil lectin domain protein [Streptomyces sp. NBC_00879]|uniref:ricin-type beta-trefoil lectin domain protein n=1 Tax=Streptomyces sp. NBC_00879 TaxID=2975855 RepID=UPI00386A127F|nr:ricin-type beta-trefoil lectin domain protein [Streptomyces sp. NBC_00879]